MGGNGMPGPVDVITQIAPRPVLLRKATWDSARERWKRNPDLGTIVPPEHPHNIAWGDADGRTLCMCAKTGLYRVRLNIPGIRP